MSFFVTLQSNFQHVMLYENPELQQKARSCIPHHQLSSAAEHKLKEAKEADPGEVPAVIQKNQLYIWIILHANKDVHVLLNSDSDRPTDSPSCL